MHDIGVRFDLTGMCALCTLGFMSDIDIRSLRERLDWTQVQLAEYLGIDRSTVSRMENGQPPARPIAKLLLVLSETVATVATPEAAE